VQAEEEDQGAGDGSEERASAGEMCHGAAVAPKEMKTTEKPTTKATEERRVRCGLLALAELLDADAESMKCSWD